MNTIKTKDASGIALQRQQLYDRVIVREKIPCVSDKAEFKAGHLVIRRPVVNLSEMYREFRNDKILEMVSIHADVVTISDPLTFSGHALRITARQMVCDPQLGLVLNCSEDSRAALELYVLDVQGNSRGGLALPEKRNHRFDLQPPGDALGIFVSMKIGDSPIPKSKVPDVLLRPDHPFAHSLNTGYQLAMGLEQDEPDLAADILGWIIRCTQGTELQREIAEQSRAALLRIQMRDQQFYVIPSLRPEVYREQALAFAESAKTFHEVYQHLADESRTLDSKKNSVEMILERQKNTVSYVETMINSLYKDVSHNAKAISLAEQRVENQRFTLELRKIEYETQIEKWRDRHVLKESLNLVMGVIKIASQLATFFTNLPALVESVTSIGEQVADGVKETTLIISKKKEKKKERSEAKDDALSAVEGMGEGGQKIGEAIYNIYCTCETAENALNAASDLLEVLKEPKFDSGGLLSEGIDFVTGGKENWEILQKEFDIVLDAFLEIPGTLAYKTELEKLIIYGKVVCECRLAYAAAVASYARQKLQRKYEQDHEKRIAGYIETLLTREKQSTENMQRMYHYYLGVKRGVYDAVNNYVRAYYYWALQKSHITPSLNDEVPAMCHQLANVVKDYADALYGFDPRPQKFHHHTIIIDTPAVLETLQKTGAASWSIPLDEPLFKKYDRVRMSTIKVRLLTVVPPHDPITLVLTASGRYKDRRGKNEFSFITRPLWWLLKYQGDMDLTESAPPEDLKQSFFRPTPFTDWTLAVPERDNPNLDMAQITGIQMTFEGNFIAQDR